MYRNDAGNGDYWQAQLMYWGLRILAANAVPAPPSRPRAPMPPSPPAPPSDDQPPLV
jgi:hypothetical protein